MILYDLNLIERLSNWCSTFMENFLFIAMGIVFVAYLVIVALGMCLGMNLGPKEKLD